MDFEAILNAIQPFVIMFAALFAAFLTAVWISSVIWVFRDIRSRSRDVFAQILATLMALLFFPLFPVPGLILYMILRPRETLAEVYERSLEEEALLQGIEERMACPGCNRRIEEAFMVCPTCHTRLKKRCPACGSLLHLRWNLCPYCGAVQTAAKAPALEPQPVVMPVEAPVSAAPPLPEPLVDTRRMETYSSAPVEPEPTPVDESDTTPPFEPEPVPPEVEEWEDEDQSEIEPEDTGSDAESVDLEAESIETETGWEREPQEEEPQPDEELRGETLPFEFE